MALPDGYIFINRGLIAYLRSEDELAGVLGHEIGHVVGAHARRSNTLGAFANILGFIGSIMTGTGAIADLTNTATATLRSGYGREFELEADAYGGEFLAKRRLQLPGHDRRAARAQRPSAVQPNVKNQNRRCITACSRPTRATTSASTMPCMESQGLTCPMTSSASQSGTSGR